LSQSGFYEYVSLAVSDSGTMLSMWKNFGISLLEILPITEITVFTALAFVFTLSLKAIVENLNKFQPKILQHN
jgi:hypothetical protein